jgi:hypothetical protein
MNYPIPVWAIRLLAALEYHEDTHSADKDPHTCVKAILDDVPADVRAHVAAWHDGYKAAERERAQDEAVPTPLTRERDGH